MKINAINSVSNSNIKKSNIKKSSDVQNNNTKNYTNLNDFYTSIAFEGKRSQATINEYKKVSKNYTHEAKKIIELSKKIAMKANEKEVTSLDIFLANLLTLRNYINEIDAGIVNPQEDSKYTTPAEIDLLLPRGEKIFENDARRKKLKAILDEHIKKTAHDIKISSQGSNKRAYPFGIHLSQRAMEDIVDAYKLIESALKNSTCFDSYIYLSNQDSRSRKTAKAVVSFETDIEKAMMIEDYDSKEKNHLSFYDDKADNLWQNLSMGLNTCVFCEGKNSNQLEHLKSSFVNLINKPGKEYKNIDPKKTDIILLNEYATYSLLKDIVKEAMKKEDRKTVIFMDFRYILANSTDTIDKNFADIIGNFDKEQKEKIKFVLTTTPEIYYANTNNGDLFEKALKEYSIQTLNTLNSQDAIKYLTDENGISFIQNKTGKKFSKDSIKKAIELTQASDGNYPDKAIDLLKKVANFNMELDEISPETVEKYATQTRNLSATSADNTEGNVIFDTNKKLSDIVGTQMTKADAQNIVRQIKNGTFKTKGYTIFQSSGSSYGGGRKHTAFSIAGETGIPVIMVNAKDFALKDIDTLSQNADLSEMKVKKLFSTAKAQAEANPNKTAMIYIENFDNFGSNSLYGVSSIYEQKAFSQLLDEMENTKRNENINLLIIGSVNMPDLLDENIMKPNKFLNSIIVYPPQNPKEVKEVFDYYINKMDLKIEGTKQEQEKIINEISQTAYGFSVVDIIYLLETAQSVSQDRNKEKIDLSDLTEAYLQTTTGRIAGSYLNEAGKKIVTSHEAGHALTLQIMNEVAKKYGENWHLPDKINFITLDPRGYYGGAMYHRPSENHQNSFEKMMSDLVCTYGGHSAEKILYGMKGSWGIVSDMEQVSDVAQAAVLDMGMGPKTGVRHIPKDALGQPNVSEHKMLTIEEDIDSFLNAAMKISDCIVECYKPFIEEFTKNHSKDVGSGNCLISSQQFIGELNDWRSRQDEQKTKECEELEKTILKILNDVKNPS